MKRRIIEAVLLLGAVGGCVNMDSPPETGGARANFGRSFGPPSIPGVQGPYGEGVPMIAPYNTNPPGNKAEAMRMLSSSQPWDGMQMNMPGSPMGGPPGANMPPMFMPPGGIISPMGIPGAPGMQSAMMAGGMPGMPPQGMMPGGMQGMPPPGMMSGGMQGMPPMPPGMMPGKMGSMPPGMMLGGMAGMPPQGMMPGGMQGMPPPGMMLGGKPGMPSGPGMMLGGMPIMPPGAGPMNAGAPPGANPTGDISQAQFSKGSPSGSSFPAQRTQVFISKPANMKVYWFTQGADGKPSYSATPLETPGRYNFAQGAIYRLKLTHIPGRPALELYPTLEVVPTSSRTSEFLAHNSVPLEFSDEDFKQVVDRNYIVKVVYLPDPQYQDDAGAGPDEIVSTRLQPGQDPIQEALRRGSILLVIRIGNIDQGLQHSPPMTATPPGGLAPNLSAPPGGLAPYTPPPKLGYPPNFQVPFNVTPIPPGGAGGMQPHPVNPNAGPQLPGNSGARPNVPNPLPLFPGNSGGNPPSLAVPNVPWPGVEKKENTSMPLLPSGPDLRPVEPTVPTVPLFENKKVIMPTLPPGPTTPLPIMPATPTPLTNAPAAPTPPIVSTTPTLPLPIVPTAPSAPSEPLRTPGDPATPPFITLPALPPLETNPELPPIPLVPLGPGR